MQARLSAFSRCIGLGFAMRRSIPGFHPVGCGQKRFFTSREVKAQDQDSGKNITKAAVAAKAGAGPEGISPWGGS